MELKWFSTNTLESNIYMFERMGKKFLVDCGGTPLSTVFMLERREFKPDYILLTHCHYDHIASLNALYSEKVKVVGHPYATYALQSPIHNLSAMMGREPFYFTKKIYGTEVLEEFGIEMLHTPGHSPESVCYKVDEFLFTGDTLFENCIGRTDLPGGEESTELESVQMLLGFPDYSELCPGHGQVCYLVEAKREFGF